MINQKHQRSLEAIVVELDESDRAEAAIKIVLLTVLAANEANQEVQLMDHVSFFTRRIYGALSELRASRN